MKWRFAGKFLLAFAVLIVAWGRIDFGERYRAAVLATVQFLSPFVSGWWLAYDTPGRPGEAFFRFQDQELPMLLQLAALSMYFIPFVSLVVATPGQGVKRCVANVLLGSLLYFLVHVVVVLAYPLIMNRPNAVKDTLGVFTGLMAFVVAPLALWFILTFPALRSLWQLGPKNE